jgi:hypothetical protein
MRRLAIGIFAFFALAPASAATFTVTNTNDSGAGSIRQAIVDANLTASDDIIEINVTGTITLTTGELTIDDAAAAGKLTIKGPGAEPITISGNAVSRIFMNLYGADTLIRNVTISNGTISSGSPIAGGGIYSSGALTLVNSVVQDNVAVSTLINAGDYSTVPLGGGIYNNLGTLTLKNSAVRDNIASADWANVGYGGGIYNFGGTLTVNDTTMSGNFGPFGGAIASFGGTLAVNGSALVSNESSSGGGAAGGGIYSFGDISAVNNSTISANFADEGGGGMQNDGGGVMTVNNSTISGNVTAWLAGGIWNKATLIISNSTIADNQDFAIVNGGTATLSNTLVVSPYGQLYGESDVLGSFESLGYNLIGNASEGTGFGAAGDQVGTSGSPIDPILGPLQDNGGPTETHALLELSPAIDAGNNSLVPAGVTTDQRGFFRVANGTVDIGAFEFGAGIPLTIDIKPGKTPNSINPSSRQKISVAILTTDTFLAFNEVDPLSVAFGPAEATEFHRASHVKDVDEDGDMDLLFHFNTQDTGIQCGDTEATLTGMTFGGEPITITGTDTIVTVNCR